MQYKNQVKLVLRPNYFKRALDWLHQHYAYLLTSPARLHAPAHQYSALLLSCPIQYNETTVFTCGPPSPRDWEVALKVFLQECLAKAQRNHLCTPHTPMI